MNKFFQKAAVAFVGFVSIFSYSLQAQTPQLWLQHAGSPTPAMMQYADVNADGKADALYFATSGGREVWVSRSTGTSLLPPQAWLQHGASTPDMMQYADVNADGKADALYFDTSRSGAVWVSLSTETSFLAAQPWLQHGPSTPNMMQYADVNGDGKADALYFDTSRSSKVWVSLSTGTGFTTPQPWLQHGASTPDMIQYKDVNGDGKADALYFDTSRSGAVWVSLSTGSTFTTPQPWVQYPAGSTPDLVQYNDVNGDRKADALYFDRSSGQILVSLSTGTSFAPSQLWVWLSYRNSPSNVVQYKDVNGDGKADVLYFDTKSAAVWLGVSEGNRFTTPQLWVQYPTGSTPDMIQYKDINGDGKADALYFNTSGKLLVLLSNVPWLTPLSLDPLNDFSKMYSHSASLKFDGYNLEYLYNDPSRLVRMTNSTESFIYAINNGAQVAKFTTYFANTIVDFKFSTSPDLVNWTPVQPAKEYLGSDPLVVGSWGRMLYTVSNMNGGYLKIEFPITGDVYEWTPEIGQVEFFTSK